MSHPFNVECPRTIARTTQTPPHTCTRVNKIVIVVELSSFISLSDLELFVFEIR